MVRYSCSGNRRAGVSEGKGGMTASVDGVGRVLNGSKVVNFGWRGGSDVEDDALEDGIVSRYQARALTASIASSSSVFSRGFEVTLRQGT